MDMAAFHCLGEIKKIVTNLIQSQLDFQWCYHGIFKKVITTLNLNANVAVDQFSHDTPYLVLCCHFPPFVRYQSTQDRVVASSDFFFVGNYTVSTCSSNSSSSNSSRWCPSLVVQNRDEMGQGKKSLGNRIFFAFPSFLLEIRKTDILFPWQMNQVMLWRRLLNANDKQKHAKHVVVG